MKPLRSIHLLSLTIITLGPIGWTMALGNPAPASPDSFTTTTDESISAPRGPLTTVPEINRYGASRTEKLERLTRNIAAAHAAQDAGKPCRLIFIGDSITENWRHVPDLWKQTYGADNPLNFGVGGDTTSNLLWRLQNVDFKDLHPQVAVVMIGTNNIGKCSSSDIAAGVQAVLQQTQKTFPGIKIILVSLLPRRDLAEINAVNGQIKTYANNQTVYYLDLAPRFISENGGWKGLGPDHLHPDATGYQMWVEAMAPLLQSLLNPS